jgi:hypothetical protein
MRANQTKIRYYPLLVSFSLCLFQDRFDMLCRWFFWMVTLEKAKGLYTILVMVDWLAKYTSL